MTKYITGFCGNGFCEGTQPKSPSGKPIKVCSFYKTCGCTCHSKFNTGGDRMVLQNPAYVPFKSGIMDFLSSYKDSLAAELLPGITPPVNVVVKEKPVTTDEGVIMTGLARSGRNFEPTKRGRAAGQLEDEIRGICNRFLSGEFPDQEICTPKFIAYQIAEETDAEKTPSVGAIGAAFDRWEMIGFAIIKRSPVRFVSFTVDGFKHGLEEMKDRYKKANPKRSR